MINMPLSTFTSDDTIPFFIQYGMHESGIYMHSHVDFSELVIVMSGGAVHIVDNERFQIKKGDVFVICNDTQHGYDSAYNFSICNIMYRPTFLTSTDFDIIKSAGFQALFVLEPHYSKEHKFCSRLTLKVEDFLKIRRQTDIMLAEYIRREEGWQTMIKSDFLKLVVTLSRLYTFKENDEEANVINLAKAISYIENNYTDNLSISHLANLTNYSYRQFIRIFKDAYNCMPADYISKLRLNNSCLLLKDSTLSITEIASRCGYGDSNYFSRIFKKYIGITPTQYRFTEKP